MMASIRSLKPIGETSPKTPGRMGRVERLIKIAIGIVARAPLVS